MSHPNPIGVSLEVRNLCRSLGGKTVLDHVSFQVAPGEIFVLMGPSGSGKTVLLKHLVGLDSPDSGDILVQGEPVQDPGLMDRHRIAMVFQSGGLLNSLSVAENVGLYLAEHRTHTPTEINRIVTEKLTLVGLSDVEDKLPAELSGGMKKRVAIARALVIEPQLILYDEPTSELDPLFAATVAREILRQNRRLHATSLIVTHDRDLAFGLADHLAILNAGRILAVDTPDRIRANPNPEIQRFLNANFNFQPESLAS
jgi:phospholipid/cholesterol/gamma-HCH transport system ATP-binding protein